MHGLQEGTLTPGGSAPLHPPTQQTSGETKLSQLVLLLNPHTMYICVRRRDKEKNCANNDGTRNIKHNYHAVSPARSISNAFLVFVFLLYQYVL